jgi:hypothetical protein
MSSSWHEPGFHDMMRRFAPMSEAALNAEAKLAAVVIEPSKVAAAAAVVVKSSKVVKYLGESSKGGVQLVKAKTGFSFPMEAWAKIIQRLPHVANLIPLAGVNRSLRSAIW